VTKNRIAKPNKALLELHGLRIRLSLISASGFFMNWSDRQAGEGFEYHLLAIAISAAILIGGGANGRWAGPSPADWKNNRNLSIKIKNGGTR
jgi:hypothetical protein